MSTKAPPAAPSETPSLEKQLLGASAYVKNLRRGPRAVLRRLADRPGPIPPQEFWDVAERYRITPPDEVFWLRVIPLMVRYPHIEVRPGLALARSGVSGARMERWLRLDGAAALAGAGRLLSHLKDGGIDWRRFGRLLYDWEHADRGPRLRRELAREFFLSPEFRARNASNGE